MINTIEEKNLPILATAIAKEMIDDKDLNWISENEAIKILNNDQEEKLYTNSENAIQWIDENLTLSKFPDQVKIFKNKVRFRELIKDQYPDYFFKAEKYKELQNLDISTIKFLIVLKPSVGFFSIGVNKIDDLEEWQPTIKKLEKELKMSKHLYPEKVVNVTDFIIEEVIEGKEYAIDCYFDENGKPVVLNILHHVFSSGKDVSDRIYSTSKEIIEENYDSVLNFLKMIAMKIHLKNFPAHVEVRIDESGKINPVEVNSLRFGGWCTTADLTWYAME